MDQLDVILSPVPEAHMRQEERAKALAGGIDLSHPWVCVHELDQWDREMMVDARLGLLPGALLDAVDTKEESDRYLGELKDAYREGSTTNLEAIECREDGKYIRGTDARHKTWLRYREEGRHEEFIEEFDVPPSVQEMLGNAP